MLDRRRFLALSGLGLALSLAGCADGQARRADDVKVPPPPSVPPTLPPPAQVVPIAAPPPLPPIPPPHPGPPRLFGTTVLPGDTRIALTIDDGYDPVVADAYVTWAMASGVHITFSPNGQYDAIWSPLAARLRPAVAAGAVQIANHTFTHPYLTHLAPGAVAAELSRNEDWIERRFGITARPWYRPPFGAHNARVDDVAGSLGFTNVLMWDGSLGDAVVLTPQVLLAQAQRYLTGGRVVLGHANHPTVTGLFDQLMAIIATRGLRPVTLDEMFATSRAIG